ncbi:MAG TPA: hypothetical protein VLI54_07055 [Bacillota bacterium]|nr:hypothetical protein [Bacillota bacterium]
MSASETALTLKRFVSPGTVMGRFFAKRYARVGALWGTAFGLITYASADGFLKLGDAAARAQLLGSLASNVGIKLLLGEPYNITAVGGFVDWRVTGIAAIVASVWAILSSSKAFRGEEVAGRWELFMSGPTTARRAAVNALSGLYAGVLALFAVVTIITFLTGRPHDIGFSFTQSMGYGLALASAPFMFVAIAAFTSQLMPIRARAATMAGGIFAACFSLHAVANVVSGAHWVLYITPLGWIELLHPLSDATPIWLLPIAGIAVVFSTLAVVIAGKRDLYGSAFADKDTARAHTRLLNSPFWAAVRLTRGASLGWLGALTVMGFLYGSLTNAAAKAFATGAVHKLTGDLLHIAQQSGAKTYISFICLLVMLVLMVYVAGAVGKIREDEAEGYVDNLLVRAVSRVRWLAGRIIITGSVVVVGGLLATGCLWTAQAASGVGLAYGDLFLAGINVMAPALLLLGITVCVFGFWPRSTTIVGYAVIAGSFLVQMVGSAVHLNHWLLDLSLLQHMALAPASDPNWRIVATYVTSGIVLGLLGLWRFTNRDLQNE